MGERENVAELVNDLFSKVQESQGFAFISDGETFPNVDEFFERIRGRLAWSEKSIQIIRAFLKKHGELK